MNAGLCVLSYVDEIHALLCTSIPDTSQIIAIGLCRFCRGFGWIGAVEFNGHPAIVAHFFEFFQCGFGIESQISRAEFCKSRFFIKLPSAVVPRCGIIGVYIFQMHMPNAISQYIAAKHPHRIAARRQHVARVVEQPQIGRGGHQFFSVFNRLDQGSHVRVVKALHTVRHTIRQHVTQRARRIFNIFITRRIASPHRTPKRGHFCGLIAQCDIVPHSIQRGRPAHIDQMQAIAFCEIGLIHQIIGIFNFQPFNAIPSGLGNLCQHLFGIFVLLTPKLNQMTRV